jgi:NADH dehydrogenase [ubiquinone] 1 alpha subcomplex assembly factor 7
VDVFHEPGNCDLTANVDFAYLKEATNDLGMLVVLPTVFICTAIIHEITIVTTYGPISQGVFLERMGLELRLQSLLKSAGSENQRKEIREAAARLVDPIGMGNEYQVMGISNELPKPEESKDTVIWPFI